MSFAVFILTHGRPDKVYTYDTLKRSGYTGKIFLLIDDEDETQEEYKNKFSEEVIIFNKKEAAKITDCGDNFNHLRGVVYARNIIFDIAKKLNVDSFLELDDDYRTFQFRFNNTLNYAPKPILDLDSIFKSCINFLKSTEIISIAFAQGGDFIGGQECDFAKKIRFKRKCMNSFFCLTERPFKFFGRLNEDVTMYVFLGSQGKIVGTLNQVSLEQLQTQTNSGGLTELYLDFGTYIKSFYSVMWNPSSVKVSVLRDRNRSRLHHSINWKTAIPKIIEQKFKKQKSV